MPPPPTRRNVLPFVVILALGVALFLPSLWGGFLLDDYYFLSLLDGIFPGQEPDDEFFAFFDGDAERTAQLAAQGMFPWWVDDELRVRVFRPLSGALLRFDHELFGHDALGYHAHSLLWWAVTLLVAGLVLRRALPGVTGMLAFLLFALDESHVLPVGWIANRNALLAVAPVLLGLWGFMRWREEGWRAGRVLMLAGAAMGLLACELALAALAYVVAYGLWGGPDATARARVRDLAPLGTLVAAYLLFYGLAGYGVAGSDLYIDPLRDPLRYLAAAAERIPILLAGGIAALSADLWIMAPAIRPLQAGLGVVVTVALAWTLQRVWSSLDPPIRRTLRWILVGAAFSLLPAVATFPADRMLLVPGFGLTAALAAVIVQAKRAWSRRRTAPRRRGLIALGGLLAIIHMGLAPAYAVLVQLAVNQQVRDSLELTTSPVLENVHTREVVLLYAPDYIVGLYLPGMIAFREGVSPPSWRPLSLAPYDHVLRRTAERTLELEVSGGGAMLRSIFGMLYRSAARPLRPGDVIDRGLMRVEILETNQDGPTRVAFHFDRALTDPSLLLLVWQGHELRRAALPEVGGEMLIKRTVGPLGF